MHRRRSTYELISNVQRGACYLMVIIVKKTNSAKRGQILDEAVRIFT